MLVLLLAPAPLTQLPVDPQLHEAAPNPNVTVIGQLQMGVGVGVDATQVCVQLALTWSICPVGHTRASMEHAVPPPPVPPAAETVTVALPTADTRPPLHMIEYVVVCVGYTVIDPLVEPPDEPPGEKVPFAALVENPLPVQDVAFFDDHVSVAPLPAATEVGEAVNVTDGVVEYGLGTEPQLHVVPDDVTGHMQTDGGVTVDGTQVCEQSAPS